MGEVDQPEVLDATETVGLDEMLVTSSVSKPGEEPFVLTMRVRKSNAGNFVVEFVEPNHEGRMQPFTPTKRPNQRLLATVEAMVRAQFACFEEMQK